LFLPEQLGGDLLVERVFPKLGDLPLKVLTLILYEKLSAGLIDDRSDLKIAALTEFDILRIVQNQPPASDVLIYGVIQQAAELMLFQLFGHEFGTVHIDDVLNKHFLSSLREHNYLGQYLRDVIRNERRQIHTRSFLSASRFFQIGSARTFLTRKSTSW